MRVAACGLWQLGSVTAACVAEHFSTIGFDPDPENIRRLSEGVPPLFEPGLEELLKAGLAAGRLSFSAERAAIRDADVVWVTYDTPVDDDDVADVEYVAREIESFFPHLKPGAVVLISSQVPAGFSARMERAFHTAFPEGSASFACSPENLRLGKALDVFRHADRIVAGVRNARDRAALAPLFAPFSERIEWMSVESAEMTKHAINAFLADSVVFINEIAVICERVGADAKEVERGLKSESRIGPRAYLGPGGAFAGGTLARDIAFLGQLGDAAGAATHLLRAVRTSNDAHKAWPRNKLVELLGALTGKKVAVLGLTYKPGTDTLRRSSSVELCQWLAGEGARVEAFDPKVNQLPAALAAQIRLAPTLEAALSGADAAVVATEWPEFRQITSDLMVRGMRRPVVVDASRFLRLDPHPDLIHAAVGAPVRNV